MAPHFAGHTPGETGAWSDPAVHKSSFVNANGARLNYLDWGGSGPVLILIHGVGDNPHMFDDLAPAFTDRFRVVAYSRRGHGQSEAKDPYDSATLTEDLRGLMDSLSIAKAHLAGWSAGGIEITAMAGTHPERVDRVVYLDAAYDWADPALLAAFQSMPTPSGTARDGRMASLDAFRACQVTVLFPAVSDPSRFEAYVRDSVVVQPDGTVQSAVSDNATKAVWTTLLTGRLDYTKVRVPALAIYASTFLDIHNGAPTQLAETLSWEEKHVVPWRATSTERMRRELPRALIVNVPGTHNDFVFTSREKVVSTMRRFLRVR